MSIEKKSLISNRAATKKALVSKPAASKVASTRLTPKTAVAGAMRTAGFSRIVAGTRVKLV